MWNPFSKNSQSVKNAGQQPKNATQLHLRIAEIRENTLVLKNGGIRAILKIGSVNFNLKSKEEQDAIIYSYQSFLNTLEFPVQIVVRSRKLDLDKYLDKLKTLGEKQESKLLKLQTFDYIDYIKRLIEYADIMEKEFYVVIPMDPSRAVKKNFIAKFWERMHPQDKTSEILRRRQEFEEIKKNLTQRVNVAVSGLENCGLKATELSTQEIISLLYQIYNPLTAQNQKVEDTEKFGVSSDAALLRP